MKKTRKTNQEVKILEYLNSVKTHPTAEVVYEQIKKELPAISLATVYRNLHKLSNNREIVRLEINNQYHFDSDMCNHQHCICKKCGNIIDIFHTELNKLAMEKVSKDNFYPDCVSITFKGLCKDCK